LRYKIYKTIYRILPLRYKGWISSLLKYADFSIAAERYAGFSIVYSLCLASVTAILFFVLGFSLLLTLVSFFSTFFLFQAFLYSILILISERRRKTVEEVLPDALQLMAANIRSGLTPDKALLLSARPEFGPLEVEIRRAAKRTISGETLENSLEKLSESINSKLLKRSVKLTIEGIKKGGELASLLEQTAEDIRHVKILLKEVSATVLMYIIFIFFAAALAAPLLYAVSTYLVETMTKIGGMLPETEVPTPTQIGITIKRVQIPVEFLRYYSLIAITITSVFGSIIIGLVKEGTEKAGIKFIPILFLISLTIFLVSRIVVEGMLAISF